MYLAPLNSDAGFKKVFADPQIAKAFLEALLNVIIEEITLIETDHKVTNAAALVKFDFRCKIKGQYVLIEMQQAHKTDVIKRFYIYHCLNTCLQLEKIKDMIVRDAKGNEHRIRNYNELDPVFTIIWMVTDTFGFKADFIEYNHYPKPVIDFLRDDALWGQEKEAIFAMREALVQMLDKKQRGLDFLAQNRMIYLFQQNIVANPWNERYSIWFEFAEKTRQLDNKVTDFEPYLDHSIFLQIMERLATVRVEPEDLLKEMGQEAYYAAKKLGEEVMERHHRENIYWQVYEEVGATFASKMNEARTDVAQAYEKIAQNNKKIAQADEKVFQAEQIAAQAQKKAAEAKAALQAEKEKQKQLRKAEREKAKQEREQLLKLEKEKAKQEREQLLKLAKQEKEQLLKLEKEKELLARLKMVQKMWAKGTSIDVIAEILEVSESQIQAWIKTFS